MSNAQQQQSKATKDDYQTPTWIVEAFNEHDHIDTDPCAGPGTEIGDRNYVEADDGLSHPWPGVVFMNPPYSDKGTWLRRAVAEIEVGHAKRVYALTPDSTTTKSWWHGIIAKHATHVWFPKGRLKFYDPVQGKVLGNPSLGTSIACFGEEPPESLQAWFQDNGWLVQTVA